MNDQLTAANELHILGKQNIAGYQFTGIEGGFGKGKKAMLVKEIAEIHEKEVKHINQRINENRSRFKDGIDIVDLKGTTFEVGLTDHNILSKMMISKSNNIYILSERGYAKLLKILEDDTAWELYDQFVDGYFNMREQQIPNDPFGQIELIAAGASNLNKRVTNLEQVVEEQLTLDYKQQRVLKNEINAKVAFIWNNWIDFVDCMKRGMKKREIYSKLYRRLYDRYSCNSYRDIRKKDFDNAIEYVKGWRGE
ncbi:ORF6N domain-containing protein [Bacillus cereus]|uniref:ORF6N domain-containing protein n=1 Tax=Bacillus cereus TaxID=1396 RepID=UPI00203CE223|nr:ORF6N domain-containing protein [Bacillus cereus]MCM3223359.1 ORF6N domain-containing protein [Bacillus cereus]